MSDKLYQLLVLYSKQSWSDTFENNWEFIEEILKECGKSVEQFLEDLREVGL